LRVSYYKGENPNDASATYLIFVLPATVKLLSFSSPCTAIAVFPLLVYSSTWENIISVKPKRIEVLSDLWNSSKHIWKIFGTVKFKSTLKLRRSFGRLVKF
jgi:hypothetical protein